MPERFEIYIVYKRRYINTLPFLFLNNLQYPAPNSNSEQDSGLGSYVATTPTVVFYDAEAELPA